HAVGIIADPDPGKAMALFGGALRDAALTVAPLACGMLLVGVAAAAAQGGLRPAAKLFKPDFKRLNPVSGLKRSFGPHAVWEALKALAKTAVLAGVLYSSMRGLFPRLMDAGSLPVTSLVETVTGAVLGLARTVAVTGLVLAFADYAVARRRIGKQLRMTKQEVKEEHKRSEGDPHMKGAIRSKQMEMSRRRMMADLPKADFVMVNP